MTQVRLNVYSLSTHNSWLSVVGLGVFHSGLEISGVEYAFSDHGVQPHQPRQLCEGVTFRETIVMGTITSPSRAIEAAVAELAAEPALGATCARRRSRCTRLRQGRQVCRRRHAACQSAPSFPSDLRPRAPERRRDPSSPTAKKD